jgi:hypothetical protein
MAAIWSVQDLPEKIWLDKHYVCMWFHSLLMYVYAFSGSHVCASLGWDWWVVLAAMLCGRPCLSKYQRQFLHFFCTYTIIVQSSDSVLGMQWWIWVLGGSWFWTCKWWRPRHALYIFSFFFSWSGCCSAFVVSVYLSILRATGRMQLRPSCRTALETYVLNFVVKKVVSILRPHLSSFSDLNNFRLTQMCL